MDNVVLQWSGIMESIRAKIKKRLKKYLKNDKDGKRSFVLHLILEMREVTVQSLHEKLKEKFNVSYNSVASMLGLIHAKLGILRARKESYNTPSVYQVKDQYVGLVKSILKKHSKIDLVPI